jgi:hypothetical protein
LNPAKMQNIPEIPCSVPLHPLTSTHSIPRRSRIKKPRERLAHRRIVVHDKHGRLIRTAGRFCRRIVLPYHAAPHRESADPLRSLAETGVIVRAEAINAADIPQGTPQAAFEAPTTGESGTARRHSSATGQSAPPARSVGVVAYSTITDAATTIRLKRQPIPRWRQIAITSREWPKSDGNILTETAR